MVFYIHGGGYYNDFSYFHWRFIKKLIRRTNAQVIAPAYQVVPYGTVKEAFQLIVPLYLSYVQSHPETKIILMGDSAGGGLALSLAEYFVQEDLPYPDELILFSPWVDVTMSNPQITDLEKKDPWLTPSYRVAGTYWAGNMPPEDWRVSPIYGISDRLHHITVFCGTHEILYSDELILFDKLPKDPSNTLIIGDRMNHVYPLIPCPEGNKAMDVIVSKILCRVFHPGNAGMPKCLRDC